MSPVESIAVAAVLGVDIFTKAMFGKNIVIIRIRYTVTQES